MKKIKIQKNHGENEGKKKIAQVLTIVYNRYKKKGKSKMGISAVSSIGNYRVQQSLNKANAQSFKGAEVEEKTEGMSKGAKIATAVGIVGVAALALFGAYKHKNVSKAAETVQQAAEQVGKAAQGASKEASDAVKAAQKLKEKAHFDKLYAGVKEESAKAQSALKDRLAKVKATNIPQSVKDEAKLAELNEKIKLYKKSIANSKNNKYMKDSVPQMKSDLAATVKEAETLKAQIAKDKAAEATEKARAAYAKKAASYKAYAQSRTKDGKKAVGKKSSRVFADAKTPWAEKQAKLKEIAAKRGKKA